MESEIRKQHKRICPPELFDGMPDMRTVDGRKERDRRIGCFVTAKELLNNHCTDDKILNLAIDDEETIYRRIGKAYSDSLPKKVEFQADNPPGILSADVEITAEILGVLDDIELHSSRRTT